MLQDTIQAQALQYSGVSLTYCILHIANEAETLPPGTNGQRETFTAGVFILTSGVLLRPWFCACFVVIADCLQARLLHVHVVQRREAALRLGQRQVPRVVQKRQGDSVKCSASTRPFCPTCKSGRACIVRRTCSGGVSEEHGRQRGEDTNQ